MTGGAPALPVIVFRSIAPAKLYWRTTAKAA